MFRVTTLLTLISISILACSTTEESVQEKVATFTWVDPSFDVAYPGPYVEGDSALSWKALRFLAGISKGQVLEDELSISDSMKLSLDNQPVYVFQPEELKSFVAQWYDQYDQIEYEAFNIRPVLNVPFDAEVFFCFGRWRYHQGETVDDRYSTILIALGPDRKVNAMTEWTMCWPKNSSLVFTPDADPRHFHYFSKNKLGNMEAAVRAVVEVQALHSMDTQQAKIYLADSVTFTPSCGNNQWLSRSEMVQLFHNTDPFYGVDPISVVPFYQTKQHEHVVLILNYESFLEDGAVRRFSYLRTFIFNEQLEVINILVQRRAVPNSVNWNWQRQ